MKVDLTFLDGPQKGTVLEIPHGSCKVLGRGSDCDINLGTEDKYVSLRHVVLDTTVSCRLIDLAGTNPPQVNGIAVKQATLCNGDIIELGYTKLRVRILTEPRCFSCHTLLPINKTDPHAGEMGDCWTYACREHVPRDATRAARTFRGYETCSYLGGGGMGSVFLVYETEQYRLLALKCVRFVENTMLVRRFLQEMLELRTLRHPNIIRFVGSDLDEFNVPFLVTEYAPDGDLMDLVQERGRLEQDLAIDIVLGVLDGLKYMHTQSDIHRDIKPQNILLRRVTLGCEDRYVPKIADFGLVKNVFRAGGGDITGLGEAMGSFEFMPPEQPSEFRTLQPSADIYATGATLYFALTGSYVIEIPPEADDQGKLGCVARAERIPIRRRLPSISSALAGVIDKACSADPLQRFQSAEEFRARLVEARG